MPTVDVTVDELNTGYQTRPIIITSEVQSISRPSPTAVLGSGMAAKTPDSSAAASSSGKKRKPAILPRPQLAVLPGPSLFS